MTNWYIKTGGDGSAMNTDPAGDWSNAAADLQTVISATGTVLATGDSLFMSDLHSEINSSTVTFASALSTDAGGTTTRVISVDDTDVSVYKRGATFTSSAILDLEKGAQRWFGVNIVFTAANALTITNVGTRVILDDCTIEFQNAANEITLTLDGAEVILNNCSLGGDGVATITSCLTFGNANYFEMNGGSITGTVTNLIRFPVGGKLIINGVDLSNVTGTLLASYGSSQTADDTGHFLIKNCILNSGVAIANEIFDGAGQCLEVWNSDDTTGDENHRFFIRKHGGDAESETSIVRTATQALPGTEKLSIKVTTSASADADNPFKFNIPVRYASTGEAAEDVATLYLTSSSSLNNIDIQARLIYPDGTINVQANVVTNAPTPTGKPWALDPLASPTTLTTSGSVWTNAQTNEYKIILSTVPDAGLTDANVAPQLEISVTKASTTIYFDSQVDLS